MNKLKRYFDKHRLLILLVVILFYGNTLKNGYSLDDSFVTEKNNITANGVRAIPKIVKSFYIQGTEDLQFDYRPMVKISFAIEHELFGVNPNVSHFFNLLLYLIGLYLLYSVLRLLFSTYHKDISLYCVILFAIMPIHTEVVSSLKNRDILLCFIFCMIGVKHFVLFLEADLKKWMSLCVSFVGFYLAFLSKYDVLPYLAITPIVVFAKDRKHLKWAIGFCVLFLVIYVLFRLTKRGMVGKGTTQRAYNYFENPLFFEKGIKYKIIATFNSLGFYLAQSVFPFKMCCYYGADTIPVLKLNYHGFIGIAFTPLLILGLIRSYIKKNYMLLVGIIVFCASISMYLNFVKPAVGIVADRFTFFASLGVAIAVIALLKSVLSIEDKMPNNFKISAIVLIIIFGIITIKRNTDWYDAHTVISADAGKYPDNAYLNYKKGIDLVQSTLHKNGTQSAEQQRANIIEARTYLERSIKIEPNYANSRNYISYVLVYLLNDFNAALPHINRSLAYKETTDLYYYKGICFRETKQYDSSEFYLLKCIAMDSRYYKAYGLLAYGYNLNKEHQKSIELFQNAIKNGVETLEIYNALGKTYFEIQNNDEANTYYQKALKLDPSNQEAAAMVKRTSTTNHISVK
ncbi:MAG: tetratricopeptide repeat protein [Bacteroidota bacterium]